MIYRKSEIETVSLLRACVLDDKAVDFTTYLGDAG
jgi:hypothetical protein